MQESLLGRIPFPTSLRQRLALVFAIILLPPIMLSIYFAWDAYNEHSKRARLAVRQFAALAANYENAFFEDTRKMLQRLANEPAVQTEDTQACRSLLVRVLNDAPEFGDLFFFNTDGTVICGTSDADTTSSVSNRGWFQEILLFRNFTLSEYTVSPGSGGPAIVAALPVYDSSGQLRGVLGASIRLFWLTTFLRDASLPAGGAVFLLDKQGNVLAGPGIFFGETDSALTNSDLFQTIMSRDHAKKIVTRRLIDFEAVGADNVRRVFSSVALPHGDVTMVFGLPAASTLGWIERDLLTRIVSLAAIWLTAIGAALIGTHYLVTVWVSSLRRMARSFASGNFSARPDLSRAPAELRDLGETLIQMAHQIHMREGDLRDSIAQKDVLLKEIHHRVKNNLQIVTSLLNIRGKSISNGDAGNALQEVQTRVRALALVHRYLYENDDVTVIDLRMFASELCQVLLNTLGVDNRKIELEVDIPPMKILSDRAVPIALLITEAVTNALKHAFPGDRSGKICVSLTPNDDGTATFAIADNGVGMAPPEAPATERGARRSGLGLSLISALARQIGGEVDYRYAAGTTVAVRLRPDALCQGGGHPPVSIRHGKGSDLFPETRS